MASDGGPRMRVTPREDGGITMRIGSLSLDLERAEAERLHEETGRALMPGQPAVAEAQCLASSCPPPRLDACQRPRCGAPEPLVTRPAGHPDVIAWDMAHGDPGPQREAVDD